jgi:hypothetical protein
MLKHLNIKFLWVIILPLALFTACAPTYNNLILQENLGECRRISLHLKPYPQPKPLHEIPQTAALYQHFSTRSINIANAFGFLPSLERYIDLNLFLRKKKDEFKHFELLDTRQLLYNKILQASIEVSSIASELNCEAEKNYQLAYFLRQKQQQRERAFTFAAIAVGAGAGIASAFLLSDPDKLDLIGVGAGIAEVGFAIGILASEENINVKHRHNHLSDLWFAKDTSETFSSPIWYYLNYNDPSHRGQISVRAQLVEKWIHYGHLAENKTKKRDELIGKFFGHGGRYSADELSNRAIMYGQVQSFINLMKQDLDLLLIELEATSN